MQTFAFTSYFKGSCVSLPALFFTSDEKRKQIAFRKHLTRQLYKISVLGGMVSLYLFLRNFDEALLENHMLLWYIFLSPRKPHVFLQDIVKHTFDFWSVLSPRKIICVLHTFCFSWKIQCVLIEKLMSEKHHLLDIYMCFFLHSSPLEIFQVF